MVKILLADDQPEVCSALCCLLEQIETVEVVAQVENVQALLAETRQQQPDLVLLDWELPGLPGGPKRRQLDAGTSSALTDPVASLQGLRSDLKVVALSGHPEARRQALDQGASAFVSKGDPPERLVKALQELLKPALEEEQAH